MIQHFHYLIWVLLTGSILSYDGSGSGKMRRIRNTGCPIKPFGKILSNEMHAIDQNASFTQLCHAYFQ